MANEVCVTWWWLMRQRQKLEWGHWERWGKRNGRKRVACRKSICVHQQLLPCGRAAVIQVPRDILCMQISHYGTLRKNSACLKMVEERTSFGRFSCKFEYFHYKIKNSSICCNLSARSNVWVKSKGAHAPPPGWPPGIWHFLSFWSNSPPCGPFLWSNAPLPRNFLGVKCPAPRAKVTKPRLISGNLNEVFNTAISIIFCIPGQRLMFISTR